MKKYKQANHIYKPYLHTLFVNFFLFALAGSIYGLITGGVGNLLHMPFYITFAVCTTFFVYKAYNVIYNSSPYRGNGKVAKKYDVLSTNKCLEPEGIVNLSDQHTSNQEQGYNPPYAGEILTLEVVQGITQDDKSNLVLSSDDKDHRSQQSPKSPSASHAHGTGSFISKSHTSQAVSQTVRSVFNSYSEGEIGDLVQSQNITSPIKRTAPTPPPIPKGNLFADKTVAQLQKNKIQCESTSYPVPRLSGELLTSIRNFNQGSLKKQKDLEQKGTHGKNTTVTVSGLGFLLKNVLEERRQASAFSDSEDDSDNHSAPNSDEWKEDVKTSIRTQEENSHGVTKVSVEESNRNTGSCISREVRLERVDSNNDSNTNKIQKPSSLFHSSSLSNLNGIDEQQKTSNLLDSSTSLNLEECVQHTYHITHLNI